MSLDLAIQGNKTLDDAQQDSRASIQLDDYSLAIVRGFFSILFPAIYAYIKPGAYSKPIDKLILGLSIGLYITGIIFFGISTICFPDDLGLLPVVKVILSLSAILAAATLCRFLAHKEIEMAVVSGVNSALCLFGRDIVEKMIDKISENRPVVGG